MGFTAHPPRLTGMKKLDKSKFEVKVNVPAIRISQDLISSKLKEDLKSVILGLPRTKRIITAPPSGISNKGSECRSVDKLILLDPEAISATDPSKWPENLRVFLDHNKAKVDLVEYTITLDYDYWSAEDIYDSILPPDLPRHYSYETIGHIAHMNMKEKLHEYKNIIGEVILSKSSAIKTVVNKLDTISDVFRTFQMEVIAGEPEFTTTIREGGCILELDFSKVYWNSKLQIEHQRLVDKYFRRNDLICDPFAGIGPFSLNAAKNKGSIVFAGDINPCSYESLCKNIKSNKLEKRVKPFLLDAKDFIAQSISILNRKESRDFVISSLSSFSTEKSSSREQPLDLSRFNDTSELLIFNHYILNLPASSFEFLQYFRDAFRARSDLNSMPLIHLYHFSKINSRDQALLKNTFIPNLNSNLGVVVDESNIVEIHNVRKVSPSKSMYCISLRLPGTLIHSS